MTSEIHLLWMNSGFWWRWSSFRSVTSVLEANKQLSTSSGWMSRAGGELLFVVQDGTTATQQALRGTRQGPVYIDWTFKIKARTLSTSKRIATFTQKGEKQTPKSMMAGINMQGRATQVSSGNFRLCNKSTTMQHSPATRRCTARVRTTVEFRHIIFSLGPRI